LRLTPFSGTATLCCTACGNHALKPRATPMMNKLLHGSQTVWTTNMPTPLLWVDIEGRLASNQNCLWEPFRNRIKFTNIMGDYKGRRSLRQRRKRFAKNRRIKALATAEKKYRAKFYAK
jgi:hypothetical protein